MFTHHPMSWDITRKDAFQSIDVCNLEIMKERGISMYTLHVPLDCNGKYSTSVNLAGAFGAKIIDEFFDYHGCKVGVVAETAFTNVDDLKNEFDSLIQHESRIYRYGDEKICGNKVAFCGGGGNEPQLYDELTKKGVNTYITGITIRETDFQPAIRAHENAKKNRINILGGTHYSTEKFACIKMVGYFNKLGLLCEFMPDEPCMTDM